MPKTLKIWPSEEQIRKMDTKRLLNILKIVRAGAKKLLDKGGELVDGVDKGGELVVGVDDKLIEDIARHLNMIERLRTELLKRENIE